MKDVPKFYRQRPLALKYAQALLYKFDIRASRSIFLLLTSFHLIDVLGERLHQILSKLSSYEFGNTSNAILAIAIML
jgi:hypothetical protein